MKLMKILPLLLLLASASYAQQQKTLHSPVTIKLYCGPPKLQGPAPMYVILHQEMEYKLDSTANRKLINPDDIKAIDVIKANESDAKYKEMGKNGVICITLKDENNFAAFKKIEPYLTVLKPQTDDQLKQ